MANWRQFSPGGFKATTSLPASFLSDAKPVRRNIPRKISGPPTSQGNSPKIKQKKHHSRLNIGSADSALRESCHDSLPPRNTVSKPYTSSPRPRRKTPVIPPRNAPPLQLYSFLTRTEKLATDEVEPPKTGIDADFIWPPPKHINIVPPKQEPLMEAPQNLLASILKKETFRVVQPEKLINEVVYDSTDVSPSNSQKRHKFNSSFNRTPGKAKQNSVSPWYTPKGSDDSVLVFESRFESGNLRRAIQVYENEYDLILKPDFNTRGHTQWYYFSVSNTRHGRAYKFNIINLVKNDSLYNWGMRPLKDSENSSYSSPTQSEQRIGWKRCGRDICYYQNAYCYPYTYTDLRRYLQKLESDPMRSKTFLRRSLCTTLAGNTCDLITITTFGSDAESMKSRKGVVVTARVHPGESNASWMMKGFLDYLTGNSLDARILRDNFIFKIIPMLNPDGVIVGNYRCSLAGIDLNRIYMVPSRKLHPTIFYTKQMIKRFTQDREVVLSVDLHGHSKKMNVFMYGCQNNNDPHLKDREKIFPRMLWKNSSIFSFRDCNFKVQKAKASTARVVIAKELGLINSYTMEATFAGANFGRLKGCHFSTRDLESMGHCFCDTILDYCDPDQTKVKLTMKELRMMCRTSSRVTDDDSDCGSDSNDNVEWVKSEIGQKIKKKSKSHKRKIRKNGKAKKVLSARKHHKESTNTSEIKPRIASPKLSRRRPRNHAQMKKRAIQYNKTQDNTYEDAAVAAAADLMKNSTGIVNNVWEAFKSGRRPLNRGKRPPVSLASDTSKDQTESRSILKVSKLKQRRKNRRKGKKGLFKQGGSSRSDRSDDRSWEDEQSAELSGNVTKSFIQIGTNGRSKNSPSPMDIGMGVLETSECLPYIL